MTNCRSLTRSNWAPSCPTHSTARSRRLTCSRIQASTHWADSGSRFAVGSSSNQQTDSRAASRNKARRWRSPVDSRSAPSLRMDSGSPSGSKPSVGAVGKWAPTFGSHQVGFAGSKPTCFRHSGPVKRSADRPAQDKHPCHGIRSAKARRRRDFPLPDAPRSPTTSPRASSSVIGPQSRNRICRATRPVPSPSSACGSAFN